VTVGLGRATKRLAEFVASSAPPAAARARAAAAVLDTIGVALAGASEPAAQIVRATIATDGGGASLVIGARDGASAPNAALANGTAAHALDFDDMCFVSLAHPSAPLVAGALAAAELVGASGASLLDAYVVGFEVEARLGVAMNPRHYERGWHCTSTLGTVGTAAAASRVLRLDSARTAHALAIAASEASGLKENFGTMVKPLHAGLAARSGLLAALFAKNGMTASDAAIDGPQGFLAAMDSRLATVDDQVADLGSRWEIIETGITVKLYPSCAGTHPTLDAMLALRRREQFAAADVDRVEVLVDSITPTVLIHERPASPLEAKFSMPFCAAAAIVDGQVGIETFDAGLSAPAIMAMMPRIVMRADPALDGVGAPLTQARLRVRLRGGRVLEASADGARGYPEHPASDDELAAKFLSCAARAIPREQAQEALTTLRRMEALGDIQELTRILRPV
jgi:2-methylcitrate dehydratase PrpD